MPGKVSGRGRARVVHVLREEKPNVFVLEAVSAPQKEKVKGAVDTRDAEKEWREKASKACEERGVPAPKATPLQRGMHFAQKRLMKDFASMQAMVRSGELTTVDAVLAHGSDMFDWHFNIGAPPGSGPLEGLILHGRIKFGVDYPLNPPRVSLYTFLDHPNTFHWSRDGVICLDMLDKVFHSGWGAARHVLGFGYKTEPEPYTGWSTAYSGPTILMQLQSFLFDLAWKGGDEKEAFEWSSHHLDSASASIVRAFREAQDFTCRGCGHNFARPKPDVKRGVAPKDEQQIKDRLENATSENEKKRREKELKKANKAKCEKKESLPTVSTATTKAADSNGTNEVVWDDICIGTGFPVGTVTAVAFRAVFRRGQPVYACELRVNGLNIESGDVSVQISGDNVAEAGFSQEGDSNTEPLFVSWCDKERKKITLIPRVPKLHGCDVAGMVGRVVYGVVRVRRKSEAGVDIGLVTKDSRGRRDLAVLESDCITEKRVLHTMDAFEDGEMVKAVVTTVKGDKVHLSMLPLEVHAEPAASDGVRLSPLENELLEKELQCFHTKIEHTEGALGYGITTEQYELNEVEQQKLDRRRQQEAEEAAKARRVFHDQTLVQTRQEVETSGLSWKKQEDAIRAIVDQRMREYDSQFKPDPYMVPTAPVQNKLQDKGATSLMHPNVSGLLSHKAFLEERVRLSMWNEPFQDWLPVYLNEQHWRKALPLIKEALSVLCAGSRGCFDPSMVLMALPKLMNTTVVSMMDGSMFASHNALVGYCAFLHTFLALANEFPELRTKVDTSLGLFIMGKGRHKCMIPSLGELLPMLAISEKYTWHDLVEPIVSEAMDRNVKWMLKQFPHMEDITLDKGAVRNERLNASFRANKTSLRVLMFHSWLTRCLIVPANPTATKAMLDATNGLPTVAMRERLQRNVKRMMLISSWNGFFARVRMVPPTESRLCSWLRQSIMRSLQKRYHKLGGVGPHDVKVNPQPTKKKAKKAALAMDDDEDDYNEDPAWDDEEESEEESV